MKAVLSIGAVVVIIAIIMGISIRQAQAQAKELIPLAEGVAASP